MPLNASKVPKELFDPYQNVLENFEKMSFEKKKQYFGTAPTSFYH